MKKIFFLLLIVTCTKWVQAQHQSDFIISYPIGFPMSNLKDYISKTSFRGINMEFNKRVKPYLDVGLEVGWNVFYEKVTGPYKNGTTTISGVQYRYVNAVPIIAGVKYYKEGKGMAEPYIGLGIGTLYVDQSTDAGLYRFSVDAWQFCARPEIGVILRAKNDPSIGVLLGLKYYAAFNTKDLDGQSYLTFNVGIVFSTRH
jgi:outer membrane protein W